MTLEDMVIDVWETLGEPNDLEFRDVDGNTSTTSPGWGRLVRALRRGLIATARYRSRRTQRALRWPGSTEYVSKVVGETLTGVVTGGSVSVVNLTTSRGDDYFLGWTLETSNGEARTIASSYDFSVVLAAALDTALAGGDEVTLRRPSFNVGNGDVVLRVTDTSTGNDLVLVRPEDVGWEATGTAGDPNVFYQLGDKVYVDPAPSEVRYLRVELEKYPTLVGGIDEEPPIPEPLHYAVVLWTLGWGFGRYVNPEMQQFYRREWEAYLDGTQLPEDNILDRQDDRFGIEMT